MRVNYKINGKSVLPKEFRRHKLKAVVPGSFAPGGGISGILPMSGNNLEGYSIAASVSPDEIDDMNKIVKEHNIRGVRFDPNQKHNCRITSNAGFREFCRVRGLHNNDSYHSH